MAFTWDRLCKARSDYPKPKFALDAIGKLLKKQPNDPYILAWKASVLTLIDGRAEEASPILLSLCQRQPPITDVNLLSFIYNVTLEAARRAQPRQLTLLSAGAESLKAWQNLAKTLPTRKGRLDLWSDLFVLAMKEECWEDVRYALVHANKEGLSGKFKKAVYYSMILTNQMCGEMNARISMETGKEEPGSQIAFALALRQMKQAYDNSPNPTDETIQVSSPSELRFMVHIYQRQGRIRDLFDLLSRPPPTVMRFILDEMSMGELELLLVDAARQQNEWKYVEKMCFGLISHRLHLDSESTVTPSEAYEFMTDICTKRWAIWTNLLDAYKQLYSTSEAQKKIADLKSQIWKRLPPPESMPEPSRAIHLTELSLADFADEPTLPMIKRYYNKSNQDPRCYLDLRSFVFQLPVHEQREFQIMISEHARSLGAFDTNDDALESVAKGEIQSWHQAKETVLSFELLQLSSMNKPDPALLEEFVVSVLKLWRIKLNTDDPDNVASHPCVVLAAIALISLFDVTSKSQYLYQATILTRYAISIDENHQDRTLLLLSARLHSTLGLGSIAFEHFGYVKAKEMLADNLSWVVLLRISQSHPFGAKGPKGFSAFNELDKVIKGISRMEARADDLLYKNLYEFSYTEALDSLALKHRLRTSLTKQFCTIERRRIARLAGRDTEDLLLWGQEDITDNCDWNMIPALDEVRPLVKPITKTWVNYMHGLVDLVAGAVFNEMPSAHVPNVAARFAADMIEMKKTDPRPTTFTNTELEIFANYWEPIACILHWIHPTVKMPVLPECPSVVDALSRILGQLNIDLPAMTAEYKNAQKSTVESTPHLTENDLNKAYGRLEVFRVFNRVLDMLRSVSKQPTHEAYDIVRFLPLQRTQTILDDTFKAYKMYANLVIGNLQRTGEVDIRAHIRQGKTGQAIETLIPDDSLKLYAKEYVDSAIEALNGVGMVRLG